MSPKPGPRYGPRRYDPLRGAQLGVSIRRTETEPVPTTLTDNRRGLLEAVHAGRVRYVASQGWRCGGKTVNGVVRECIAAGWAVHASGTSPGQRALALTTLGRKAIGADE